MKVAVTSTGPDLEAQVDPRFGRCQYFLIVESESMECEAIENPNSALGGGAGIQSGQMMSSKEVKVVLTGNCGPNAYATLASAGIDVIVGVSGGVREVVEQYKKGELSPSEEASVRSHFGMGQGGGKGGGMGGGGGGMGRGGGKGGGMGGGGGMGRGGGKGGGMGNA